MNTQPLNLWDAIKAVLRIKNIALKTDFKGGNDQHH